METAQAYPLHWPPGRARTKFRNSAKFHTITQQEYRRSDGTTYARATKNRLSISTSRDRVIAELTKLGGSKIVMSSNLRLRGDGLPMSSQREPDDPGVAVYFQLKSQPHCLSCDTWNKSADNLAAIAKHVEAMRGQIRWGVADIASMFAGFKALPNAVITPSPMTVEEAAAFFAQYYGGNAPVIMASPDNFTSAFRTTAARFHPDKNGGSTPPEWHRMQQAADLLKRHHGIA